MQTQRNASMDDIHSCSYFCRRASCIEAQRDYLRDLYVIPVSTPPASAPAYPVAPTVSSSSRERSPLPTPVAGALFI